MQRICRYFCCKVGFTPYHATMTTIPFSFKILYEKVHCGLFWQNFKVNLPLQWMSRSTVSISVIYCWYVSRPICVLYNNFFEWAPKAGKYAFSRVCLKCWHGGAWKPLFFLSLQLIKPVKHKTDCQRFITDHIHDGDWHYSARCVPKPRPKVLSHTPFDWGIWKKSRGEVGPEMW